VKRLIKKSNFDNVYAIRFIAFLAIFFAHAAISFDPQIKVAALFSDVRNLLDVLNTVAYSLIFVLTGFLNTWSIFEERFIYKKMNVLRFYMRRLIVVVPLFAIALILGIWLMPSINSPVPRFDGEMLPIWRYFTLTSHFSSFESGNPYYELVGNLWSLETYIYFILVWPFLMRTFRRKETTLFALLFAGYIAFQILVPDYPSKAFFALNYLPEFATGSYLAYISFFKYPNYDKLKEHTRRTIGFTYLGFILFILFKNKISAQLNWMPEQIFQIVEKTAIALTLGYFIFEQNFNSNSVLKAAKMKFMNFPGKIVLSLYIYMPLGVILSFLAMGFVMDKETEIAALVYRPLIALAATIVIASISYEYLEKKFVRLRKIYNPTREYNPSGLQDVKAKNP
jgi:peptidoglycan/LPS O-acetylase OafA/YrhL